eukprot:TRINITY_DN21664_c0_g1_i1.p1 TRINITY_DN21664_c0_g1~~TRINITY_DN21664_c0_g1_i1.p1  ORF type:complete len:1133 (-),score=223.70 TRINITY_DN21664_c0_g1_i1:79-3390(-)
MEGAADDPHGAGAPQSKNGVAGGNTAAREGVLVSQLIQLLSQRARHSIGLAELDAKLPGHLRQRAKDQGGLKAWLQGYPSFFFVGGPADAEEVTLILGRPRPGAQQQPPLTPPHAGLAGAEPMQLTVANVSRVAAEAAAAAGCLSPGIVPSAPPALPPPPKPAAVAAALAAASASPSTPRPKKVHQEHRPPAARGQSAVEALAAASAEAVAGAAAKTAEDGERAGGTAFDEEIDGDSAVQLRGLPYRATAQDVHGFLGPHAAYLAGDAPIFIVHNRDGKPSGFARVSFVSPEAARRARDALHNKEMDERYVEVFLYSERPIRSRQRRGLQEDGGAGDGQGARASSKAESSGITREHVVRECRCLMAHPKKRRLLMSTVGAEMSAGARTYLKHMDQGLKSFLALYPNEFAIEGTQGSEYVHYMPLNEASDKASFSAPVEKVGTPKSAKIETTSLAFPTPLPTPAGYHEDFLISPKESPMPMSLNPTPSGTRFFKTPSEFGMPMGGTPWPAGTNSWIPPWPSNVPPGPTSSTALSLANSLASFHFGGSSLDASCTEPGASVATSPGDAGNMGGLGGDGSDSADTASAALAARVAEAFGPVQTPWPTPQPPRSLSSGQPWAAAAPASSTTLSLADSLVSLGLAANAVDASGTVPSASVATASCGASAVGGDGSGSADAESVAAAARVAEAIGCALQTPWPTPQPPRSDPSGQFWSGDPTYQAWLGAFAPWNMQQDPLAPMAQPGDSTGSAAAAAQIAATPGAAPAPTPAAELQAPHRPAAGAETLSKAAESQRPTAAAETASKATATSSGASGTSPAIGNFSNAVRLRGLPYSASAQDVLAFFAQHDIVDRVSDGPNAVNLMLRSNGKASGQAVVQMRCRADAEMAQNILSGHWMGKRYIEVFLYGEDGLTDIPIIPGGGTGSSPGSAPPQKGATGTAPQTQAVAVAATSPGTAVSAGAPHAAPAAVPNAMQLSVAQAQAAQQQAAAALAAQQASAAQSLVQQQTAAQQHAAAQAVAAATVAGFNALPSWPPPWSPPASLGMNSPGVGAMPLDAAATMGLGGMAMPPMMNESANSWEALYEFLCQEAHQGTGEPFGGLSSPAASRQ